MADASWPIDPSLCAVVVVGVASLVYLSSKRQSGGAQTNQADDQVTNQVAHQHDTYPKHSGVGVPHPYTKLSEYKDCVYMDNNATTPVYPEVTAAMMPFLTTSFGNPSSSHIFSRSSRKALEEARLNVGALINARDPLTEVYFTSCGTESDNRMVDIAMYHFMQFKKKRAEELGVEIGQVKPHVVTCKTEHPAVICYLRILRWIEERIDMTVVPVDAEGFVNPEDVRKALTPNTALVTFMHSNNEVGTLHPLKDIAQVVRQYNQQMQGEACVLLHTDAAQSLGKVPVDVQDLGVDMLTVVGHKYGAPKGVGALYIKRGIVAPPLLVGGGQERGLRSGTENVALVTGLGAASRLAMEEGGQLLLHQLTLKQRLIAALVEGFAGELDKVKFNGPARANNHKELLADLKVIRVMIKSDGQGGNGGSGKGKGAAASLAAVRSAMNLEVLRQLPNTVSVSFKGILSYEVIAALSDKVACSAGSACHAVHTDSNGGFQLGLGLTPTTTQHTAPDGMELKMSEVLTAMGVAEEFGLGTLRLSVGRHTTERDVDLAAAHIVAAIKAAWSQKKL